MFPPKNSEFTKAIDHLRDQAQMLKAKTKLYNGKKKKKPKDVIDHAAAWRAIAEDRLANNRQLSRFLRKRLQSLQPPDPETPPESPTGS